MGLHRHVVRFVQYDEGLYVLKELPRRYVEREYDLLRYLADVDVPAVTAVGKVTRRVDTAGEALSAVLITRHLAHSLPYRLLFARRQAGELRDPMLDALVDLLVRIHLVGFMWGDCSLSNTLFRRDAGRLAAYVVDVETGERHPTLTDGQRMWDIDLAIERCAGELFDLQASGLLPDVDPTDLADDLRSRYAALWSELTREEVFGPDERHRIDERLRRINDLGYDVGELELTGHATTGGPLRLKLHVVEPARHERLLRERTGIEAEPGQARRLLQDIQSFGAWLRAETGLPLSEDVVAHRWMEQSWGGVLSLFPGDVRQRRESAELFVGALDHWHRRSRESGTDLDLFDVTRQYVALLADEPDERIVGRTMVDPALSSQDDAATER